MLIICLGFVGMNERVVPTGTNLFSWFFDIEHVIHESHTFLIVCFAFGW
jgi:hypothetical protein